MSNCRDCDNNCCPDLGTGSEACDGLHSYNNENLKPLTCVMDMVDPCELPKIMKKYINGQTCLNDNILDNICALWNTVECLESAMIKILTKLEEIGVWKHTGDNIMCGGDFVQGMGIAGGNINLFGGNVDSSYYIRTNSGKTENDITAGI